MQREHKGDEAVRIERRMTKGAAFYNHLNKEKTTRKIGKYEILRELGRGAMGVVFKARDPLIRLPRRD